MVSDCVQVEDLQVQLHREAARCNQLERVNGELQNQLDSLSSLSHQNQQLEKSKHQLEEEVLDLRRRMEATQAEYSQVAKERIRQEVQHKLEEVNLFLQVKADGSICGSSHRQDSRDAPLCVPDPRRFSGGAGPDESGQRGQPALSV